MNEHIKEYCENFIESPENPHFAIFIKGAWGSGKTFFIDNLLKKYDKNEKTLSVNKSQIIKISLFGVNSFEDIDTKIYQAIHPVLSSGGMKIAGAVARTALRLGTNIDFNKDGKYDASLTIGGFPSLRGKKAKNIDKKLIVVDDLERTSLEPKSIFGYFSEIIIESTTKVIFIGNEDKIFEKDEHKKKEYLQVKEKTIGIEFEIESNKENATQAFVSSFNFENEDKEFLKNKLFTISEVLECNNLRILWQALYNLNLLIEIIKNNIEDKDKKLIYEIFLVLYIQNSLGQISCEDSNDDIIADDILPILTAYFNYNMSYKNYKKHIAEGKKDDAYFFPSTMQCIPLLDIWKKIIFDGYYDKAWIIRYYKDEKEALRQQKKEVKNLFKLISNWQEFKKEDFEPLVKKVFTEFESGIYLHPGEILLFTNYMILFAKWRIIPNTVNSIIDIVNKLITSKEESIQSVQDWEMLELSYKGYGFTSGLSELNLIKKRLQKINVQNTQKDAKLSFQNELITMSEDVDKFIKSIIHMNENYKYYKQPILSFIDVNDFYKKLQELSISDQDRIIMAFSKRYGKVYDNEPFMIEYAPDFDNLRKLRDAYKSNIQPLTYNPQMLIVKNIIINLDELVEYFGQHLNIKISSPNR